MAARRQHAHHARVDALRMALGCVSTARTCNSSRTPITPCFALSDESWRGLCWRGLVTDSSA